MANFSKSPKVAVLGCGYWGKNLVRNFAELNALQAVADSNEEAAKKYAELYGVAALSVDEALASDVDGVIIAAPAEHHLSLALKAFDAGKHVYVEKPLALSVSEGEKIRDASIEAGKILMVGHLLQYHPVFSVLRNHVRAGNLGKLRYAYSNRLSMGKFRIEEDALWSLAAHDVSMLLALFDSAPIQVRLSGADFITPGVADEARLDMAFPSGGRAHVFVSWLHPFKEQRLVVVGEDGMMVFDDTKPWEEKLALYAHCIDQTNSVPTVIKSEPEYIAAPPGEPLKLECEHFLDCIRGNRKPITDGEEALRVLRVLDAERLPKII